MDYLNAIVNIISNNAFPIVACYFLFKSNEKEGAAHAEEVKKLTEAIGNNTNSLTRMSDLINIMLGKVVE